MLRMITRLLAVSAVTYGFAGATAVLAEQMESNWTGIEEAEVRLIAGHVQGEGDMLGLHFVMAPKWKVYWRSPGDAGFPPRPDWSGTTGMMDQALEWPLPTRFTFFGLETFGYEDEIVLPIRINRIPGQPDHVRLNLFYAACAEICVPVRVDMILDLPAGEWPVNRHARMIASALAMAPKKEDGALTALSARMEDSSLVFGLETPIELTGPDLIVEGPPEFVFGRPDCAVSGNQTECRVPVIEPTEDVTLAGQQLRLTLSGSAFAAETEVTVAGR
jgi:suppressor for copper-sensitivity B